MYRRILVPIDGSAVSRSGLETAIGLATEQSSRLHFLHVIDLFLFRYLADQALAADDPIIEHWRNEGRQILARAESKAREKGLSASVALVDASNDGVADAILAESKRIGADLVIMGTHGRRGTNSGRLGGEAASVATRSHVPVLLVPAEAGAGH